MRLLHVTQRYLPAIGGAEKYIADLSEELVRRGHQVDVFTSRALDYLSWRSELPRRERMNGVNVYRFPSLVRGSMLWKMLEYGQRSYWRTRHRRYEPLIFLGGGPISPAMFWAMLTRGRRYDLFHLNTLVYGHVAYGYWAARCLDIPVVTTPHTHAEQENTYSVGYQRRVLRGADHVIAVTAAERDFLLGLGLDAWRVSTSGNGLRLEEYEEAMTWDQTDSRRRLGLPAEGFLVLFLGRKSYYKGLDVALDAHVLLQPQHPQVRFLAIGPETDYSEALWRRYERVPNLHVLGAVSDDKKLAALQACDCLVLPSTGEAFGIVFLEAWIMGKPVIGARTVAVESVVSDGHDGFLVAPGDAAAVAVSVERLVGDPDLRHKMGVAGRSKVLSRFVVPRIADRVEGIYLRVLRDRWRAQERRN